MYKDGPSEAAKRRQRGTVRVRKEELDVAHPATISASGRPRPKLIFFSADSAELSELPGLGWVVGGRFPVRG